MEKRKTVKEKNNLLAEEGKEIKNFGLVLRVYPTEEQAGLINRTIGCARLIFNKYLDARKTYYQKEGKTLSVSRFKKV